MGNNFFFKNLRRPFLVSHMSLVFSYVTVTNILVEQKLATIERTAHIHTYSHTYTQILPNLNKRKNFAVFDNKTI